MSMGNIIVGQSGGPTSVINASLAGVFKTALEKKCSKIYGMRNGIQGLLENRYVNLSEHIKNSMDLELLKRTPSSFLGSCRFKLPDVENDENVYKEIFNILKNLEIEHFFYIGGNDSMDTIKKLSSYAKTINSNINFIGVPKTIDNDLAVTDHTPGYGSASKFIGASLKEIIRDGIVYNNECVTIVEIMGRNAGWLTAAAALAKDDTCEGVDMILLPEVVFDYNKFLNRVKTTLKDKKSQVIVVSEGIKTADGKYVCESSKASIAVDSFGHKSLSGTSQTLASLISENIDCKTRPVEFSTLQRCAAHIASKTDVDEAFAAGGKAVDAAVCGESGKVVIFERISNSPYSIKLSLADADKIANVEKTVPAGWITNDGTNVSMEVINYIRPLIQGEMTQIMVDGLPAHLIIK